MVNLGGTIADGASVSGSSGLINMSVIPERIMVFARYSDADLRDGTQSLCDAFMPITSIQCSTSSAGGMLSGATPMTLWGISDRNGARSGGYNNWRALPQASSSTAAGDEANGSGGPLLLSPAADLQLPPGVVPGMKAQYSFSVDSIVVENRYGRAITNPALYIVAITGGVLSVAGNGESQLVRGGIPGSDSDAFKMAKSISSAEFHRETLDSGYGGSKVGDWFKQLGHNIDKTASALGKDVMSVIHGASQHAPELALAAAKSGAGRGGARAPRSLLYHM